MTQIMFPLPTPFLNLLRFSANVACFPHMEFCKISLLQRNPSCTKVLCPFFSISNPYSPHLFFWFNIHKDLQIIKLSQ